MKNFKKIIDQSFNNLELSQSTKNKLLEFEKTKAKTKSNKILKFALLPTAAAVVVMAFLFTNIFSPAVLKVSATDLMKDIKPQNTSTTDLTDSYKNSITNLCLNILKTSDKNKKNKNTLISPISIYLALAMTANGANSETLSQFETLLGNDLSIEQINEQSKMLSNILTTNNSGKVSIGNSIWFRDDSFLNVKNDFLQTNANFYSANAYKTDFNKKQTITDINNWVDYHTKGKIKNIIDKIDPNTIMYLLNTVYFEQEWASKYTTIDVSKRSFTLANGDQTTAEFMHSTEYNYFEGKNYKGMLKPYKDQNYSFLAILPEEKTTPEDLIKTLPASELSEILKTKNNQLCLVSLPKFSFDDTLELVDPLKALGFHLPFDGDKADFTKLGSSERGNIFISDILHKTNITVNENGTIAAAVTKVEMNATAAPEEDRKTVNLDRPFIYAIVNNETGIPLFMGILNNPNQK